MAEGLLRQAVNVRERNVRIASAGIAALVGESADPIAIALTRERGVDIGGHRARQLTGKMIRGFSLILAMDRQQVNWMHQAWPQVRGRVFRWGHWQDCDVPDPHRKGRQAFIQALDHIDAGLEDWRQRLVIGVS
jgi:protein-tyrosine phosphatase